MIDKELILSSTLKSFIIDDKERMEILRIVRSIKQENLWIAGGFVRNLVWDRKHNYIIKTELGDIDVFYFNDIDILKTTEISIENELYSLLPNINWSVKNQARMNIHNKEEPYLDLQDALMRFPETASAVAVKLNHNNSINILAPLGLDDLFNLVVRPTSLGKSNPVTFENFINRYKKKKWKDKWPLLKIYNS